MNSKNVSEREERRFCRICESYIKPKAAWDNPRRDRMYPGEWLCKTHWMTIENGLLSEHKRLVSELKRKNDDKTAKSRIKKSEVMDLGNIPEANREEELEKET